MSTWKLVLLGFSAHELELRRLRAEQQTPINTLLLRTSPSRRGLRAAGDLTLRRLRQRHALVIGNVTAQFPLMFEVDPLKGVNTAGETRYFFLG